MYAKTQIQKHIGFQASKILFFVFYTNRQPVIERICRLAKGTCMFIRYQKCECFYQSYFLAKFH